MEKWAKTKRTRAQTERNEEKNEKKVMNFMLRIW